MFWVCIFQVNLSHNLSHNLENVIDQKKDFVFPWRPFNGLIQHKQFNQS